MNQTQGTGANSGPAATSAAVATEPSGPPKKKVVAVKVGGSKWAVRFDGSVNRRDIAHLSRLIRIEFLRSKRKDRLERRKADRAKENDR